MPRIDPAGEAARADRVVRPARRGHAPVGLPEAHHAAVARAAEEDQVGAVRPAVVGGPDPLVGPFLPTLAHRFPSFRVPGLQSLRRLLQGPPDFHERPEGVGGESPSGSEHAQHRTAPKEGLVVGVEPLRKIRGDLVCESLLVADPLEQLHSERPSVCRPAPVAQRPLCVHTRLRVLGEKGRARLHIRGAVLGWQPRCRPDHIRCWVPGLHQV